MAKMVTIVGGGLAGMVAALELLERGTAVHIIETSHRLGGKAGANQFKSDWDEHGWHLFPLWYLNTWGLVEKLKIRSSFVDKSRYGYMKKGEYPHYIYLENPFSWKTAFHNLFHGVLQPWDSFLYQYALLDLMSQPVRHRAQLDQVTVNGFARSRFYGTEAVVSQLEDTVSRASAIESYEMSAMTVRNVMRFWFNYHNPWFRILNGDLQTKFIQPLEKRIRESGGEVTLNATVVEIVVREDSIRSLRVSDPSGVPYEVPVDTLLLAVAPEDVRPLLSEELLAAAPELANIHYLRSRVMAGMTIYFKSRIPGIPQDHINFVSTKYALSMIDVTDTWGLKGGSVVCVVVSDYTSLQGHSPERAKKILLEELSRYLPFLREEDIERVDFQPHVEHPLFANTAGAWAKRPGVRTRIANLFMAGDYCKTHVDLTCMEGAVVSGLLAAEAMRLQFKIATPVLILEPTTKPRLLLVLLKWLLLPGALIALAVGALVGRNEK